MFVIYNPNPMGSRTGDCVIRALTKAFNVDWYTAYIEVVIQGYLMADMPSGNHVWGEYLKENGYKQKTINETGRYTVRDFCRDHKRGTFVVATGSHVATVKDGDYYDTWDSGAEIPVYYFEREE